MGAQLGTLVVPVLASAPGAGAEGGVYYNSTSNTLFTSDGASWSAVGGGGGATVSDTAPGSPTAGMLWLNSTTLGLTVYYDSQWIEVGVGSGSVVNNGATSDIAINWFYE